MRINDISKVAFVGDYLPRKCGIATFTSDMHSSIAGQGAVGECFVVPVNDRPEGYDYPPEVRFEIDEQDFDSYLRAADFLNFANTDVVCLQHEYGIFGGPAGSHVLGLVRDLRMPVVTTFHTVLKEPDRDQRRVLSRLAELSARVVVMTARAKTFLRDIYEVPASKIDLIAHGIPDTPFVEPDKFKEQFGVEGRRVALTFGLLSPNKGIEHMLRAVPGILKEFPDFVYIVLGATHPDLVRHQGERYRLGLERLARDLGIRNNVIFYNRFVELNELTEFIRAADLYVTPYLNPAQITSGTLAYSFGCGKAIVSTPYWHAEELLAEGRGVLVPFADSAALAREIRDLLRDDERRLAMCRTAYELGREMVWKRSADHYVQTFQRARPGRQAQRFKPLAVRTLAERRDDLPDWRLDHLSRMTDATGIFQHATYTIPNFAEGYCTDDNVNGAPFYLMDFLAGPILRQRPDAERFPDEADRRAIGERVVDTLVAIHAVDPDAAGLGELGKKEDYVARQLRRWQGQWEKSKTRELAAVDRVHDRLAARIPEQGPATIVHGDYRLDNMILTGGGEVAAVVDWELCTLGDPLADLGTLLAYWPERRQGAVALGHPANLAPGFPERDELVSRYAERSGRDVSNLSYYLALGYWKLAVILEGVYARTAAGAYGSSDTDLDALRLLVERLAEAAEQAEGG